MKVCISYPPLGARKGTPLLSQNRQFQWFKNPTYIYPVVPAYAATMLKDRGFEVVWDDAIAERLSMARWLSRVVSEHRPDLIVMETKTPVVRAHWEIIRSVKKRLPNTATVLVGDHVTARPRESMDNCPVDFILTGGDYDFLVDEPVRDPSPGSVDGGVYRRCRGQARARHMVTEKTALSNTPAHSGPGTISAASRVSIGTSPDGISTRCATGTSSIRPGHTSWPEGTAGGAGAASAHGRPSILQAHFARCAGTVPPGLKWAI